ncbi:MAG: glycosyltransferase [Polyangiaceae bacterium]|nr:glycosyltransferase [Polyangiaceae bacterium]
MVSPVAAAWQRYFERADSQRSRFRFASAARSADLTMALRRLVPADASVLEVGCGKGAQLRALPNAVRHGIDGVAATVALAQSQAPGCEVVLGDALTFDRSERYDAIVCDKLCHTVPDVQRLLDNLARHLAPGGRIFLTCFNGLLEPAFTAAELSGLKRRTPPMNWLSESDFENLFRLTGLEVVRFEDRMLLPAAAASMANRYLAPLPGLSLLSLYRIYVLRRTDEALLEDVSVTVVVPARNEAGNITEILRRVPKMGSRTELVFVEGGSTDETWPTIQREAAGYSGPLEVVCCQQPGRGKGDAVREGFARATGDLLMILDADLTVVPEDLPKFYAAALGGVGDYIQGTRLVYPMEGGAMRFLNRLGNVAFSRLFTFLLNQQIKDTLCGTKVIWREDYLRLAARRHEFGDFDPFGDFDLIFGAVNQNLRLVEIPVRYRSRTYGTTNISRFRHGLLLLKMSAVAARKLKFV